MAHSGCSGLTRKTVAAPDSCITPVHGELVILHAHLLPALSHLIQQHFIDGTEAAQGYVGASDGRNQSDDEDPDGQNPAALHNASFRRCFESFGTRDLILGTLSGCWRIISGLPEGLSTLWLKIVK